jgi:hypothetical protein
MSASAAEWERWDAAAAAREEWPRTFAAWARDVLNKASELELSVRASPIPIERRIENARAELDRGADIRADVRAHSRARMSIVPRRSR